MDRRGRAAVAGVAVLFVAGMVGCSDGVGPELPPEVGPSLMKGGNGNGGGKPGDGGGSTGPEAGNVETTFADRAGDGVFSDGLGLYRTIKKRQELASEISSDGRHWLEINPGPTGRSLCVDFPPAGADSEIVLTDSWNELVSQSGGAVDLDTTYCGEMTFHTRDHSQPGKLLGMDADATDATSTDVQTSGGKVVLVNVGTGDSWEWRLLFDDQSSTVGSGASDNGVCIHYGDDGTWTVGNDPTVALGSEDESACNDVDEYLNLIRVYTGGSTVVREYVARFRMPFRYTIRPE